MKHFLEAVGCHEGLILRKRMQVLIFGEILYIYFLFICKLFYFKQGQLTLATLHFVLFDVGIFPKKKEGKMSIEFSHVYSLKSPMPRRFMYF